MKRKINTFIIGAQKAGTTSLYDWLGQHPDILAPQEIKDYHFFSDNALYKKGETYFEDFYKSSNVPVRLHSAVNYLYFDTKCAERLHKYNPNSKLIICLRNPVDRAVSAFKYFKRTLREPHTFSEALNKELNNELQTHQELANNTYIAHGMYYKQIQFYLNYFNRDQIFFVFFEELTDSSKQIDLLKRITKFLEVDDDFEFKFFHLNASGSPRFKFINFIIRKSSLTKILKNFFPFGFRKRLAKKIEQKTFLLRLLK